VSTSRPGQCAVEGWYLARTRHGDGDILFATRNPGGHLPVTIARSVGQLPMFYNYKPSGHRRLSFEHHGRCFPFGWGVSYTSFDHLAARLSTATIKPTARWTVLVDVKNTARARRRRGRCSSLHQQVASVTVGQGAQRLLARHACARRAEDRDLHGGQTRIAHVQHRQ